MFSMRLLVGETFSESVALKGASVDGVTLVNETLRIAAEGFGVGNAAFQSTVKTLFAA